MAQDRKEYRRKYYLAHRQEIIARAKKWNKDNPEKAKEHCDTYQIAHRQDILTQQKSYRKQNRATLNAKSRERALKYYYEHQEEIKEKSREYYRTHKQKKTQQS